MHGWQGLGRRAARALGGVVLVAALSAWALPVAAQTAGSGGWTAGPDATGDNSYSGYVDVPAGGAVVPVGASVLVGGWVVDTTAQGWAGIDQVQVYSGPLGSGGKQVATGLVAQDRSDVASALNNPLWSASGFSALVPADALSSGGVTLTVYAHAPAKGWWSKQVSFNVGGSSTAQAQPTGFVATLQAPSEAEVVLAQYPYTVRGIAYDTNTRAGLGAGVDRVQVYLDGVRGVNGSQYLGDAQITGTTWSLDFSPTRYTTIAHHNLYVYVRSAVSGQEQLLTRGFDIR